MTAEHLILCPVDFSTASAGALRYAALLATHFNARVIALTIEDPLLTEALDLGTGIMWDPELCKRELARFVGMTLGDDAAARESVDYECAVGKPAAEILRVSRDRACELIVMSSHGLTGARRLFFGSTTERVLRETTTPVLVTPPVDPGPIHFEDARRLVRRLLVPVDLSAASLAQTKVAASIAEALDLPAILAYVIEPIRTPLTARLHVAGIQGNRRALADDRLKELLANFTEPLHSEALLAYGDPAEELAKVASDRDVGLIVVGLHGSPQFGPRMGSVTYRILCLTKAMVLAVPPRLIDTVDGDANNPATTAAGFGQSAN
jgi:nucleotide-binding universal stress UspA family protein